MSGKQRPARGEKDAADERLAPILHAAHARLRLSRFCSDETCQRTGRCAGDANQCGARAAAQGWAWLRHVVRIMLAGKSQEAAVEIANFAALGYRQRRILRWPGVPCWDPVEFVQVHDGSWARVDQVPSRPPLDPQFFELAASPWLRMAVDAEATPEATAERGPPDPGEARGSTPRPRPEERAKRASRRARAGALSKDEAACGPHASRRRA
jgi:hypothetical protein